MRKSGSGRSGEVALPYVQIAFRTTARTGSGIVGTSVARLRIAELLHQLPRFGLDLVDLLAREVAAPAADRLYVHAAQRLREQYRIDAEVHGQRLRGRLGVGGERLVADVDRARRRRPSGGHVAPPGPTRSPRLARVVELLEPLRLDPEARALPVGLADVVASGPSLTEPALLHERRRHVSRIPDHVHDRRLRVRAQRRRKDERRLGRLLDRTEPAHEAVTPDSLEHPAQLGGGGLLVDSEERGDRRLPQPELAQVGEAGHLPDRAGDEARARAR